MDYNFFLHKPEYPPSTCTVRKGKYYVSVTVPKQIASLFKTKQIRRSTGTSDLSLAKQRQHALTEGIYRHIDAVWKEALFEYRSQQNERWEGWANEYAKQLGVFREGFDAERHRLYLSGEAKVTMDAAFSSEEELDAEAEAALLMTLADHFATQAKQSPQSGLADGTPDGAPTITSVLPSYLKSRNWEREKSKDAAKRQIERFASMVGSVKLAEIEKTHAYDYAQAMNDAGYAHKTIRSSVSAVAALLDWCERNRLIKLSPFVNLKLSDYGKAAQSYRPFSKNELHQIFQQEMPPQERLLLSLLITTGMRLDEAALLNWDRVKEVDGIRCISLIQEGPDTVIVKNSQSNRLIALPDCLELPARGSGRLFDYRKDKDGKAENAASRALMKIIRKVSNEKQKVVHSLRGTLKDLLRDADVTKEVNDFITGHSQGDEAGKYGSGPSLETKYKAVNAVAHPWLKQTS